MTFYYDEDENELRGNNAFHPEHGFAYIEDDGSTVVFDVDYIMDEGRAMGKLKEMRSAIDAAIEANEE